MNKRRRYKSKARRRVVAVRRRFGHSGDPLEMVMTFGHMMALAVGGDAQRIMQAFCRGER